MSTTVDLILDAAERLFARQGIAATSLRAITTEASVNAAAIHYHFGSKQALLDAVVARRIAPVKQEQLRRLEGLERAPGRVDAHALLWAFLMPLLGAGGGTRSFGLLLAWLRLEEELGLGDGPSLGMRQVKARFAEVACRGRDDLDHAEATERLEYAIGAMIHCLRQGRGLSGDRADRLISFLAAGFSAPAQRSEEGEAA